MKNCKHSKEIYEEESDFEWDSDKGDFVDTKRLVLNKVSTFKDLDTHRLKCSICGKIEYYSKAAEDFYEKGIFSQIINF